MSVYWGKAPSLVARALPVGHGEQAHVDLPVIDLLTPLGEAGSRRYELTAGR